MTAVSVAVMTGSFLALVIGVVLLAADRNLYTWVGVYQPAYLIVGGFVGFVVGVVVLVLRSR